MGKHWSSREASADSAPALIRRSKGQEIDSGFGRSLDTILELCFACVRNVDTVVNENLHPLS